MHWPRIHGLAASAGVWLRAKETEISAAPWASRLGKGLYLLSTTGASAITLILDVYTASVLFVVVGVILFSFVSINWVYCYSDIAEGATETDATSDVEWYGIKSTDNSFSTASWHCTAASLRQTTSASVPGLSSSIMCWTCIEWIQSVWQSLFLQYYAVKVKVKAVISSYWKSISELRGVACYMGSHGITCHPTQANTPHINPSQWKLLLDLSTLKGWKAELTWVASYIPRWFTRLQTVTHPSINRARRRVTTLIKTNALPLC